MLNPSTVTSPVSTTLPGVLDTMRAADPRLVRLVFALTFAFIVMSALALPLGCTTAGHLVNSALDDATLLMFAMLPVLYLSGRQRRS